MINFVKMLEQQDLSAHCPTGYEDCIIGLANRHQTVCLVLSENKIIQKLAAAEGMSDQEAGDFFEFNISRAYVGKDTPFFVDDDM